MTKLSGVLSLAPGVTNRGTGRSESFIAAAGVQVPRSCAATARPLPALASSMPIMNDDKRPFCCASPAAVMLRLMPSDVANT
jgi:hypothetical protein